VVMTAEGVSGEYPDLPGCTASERDLEKLKARLERLRRDYLTSQVRTGKDPPMPNSHLEAPEVTLGEPDSGT